MTQEYKQLLLKDLCARLPYGVKCDRLGRARKLIGVDFNDPYPIMLDSGCYIPQHYKVEDIKPYLRPMSSMTEEDMEDFAKYQFANDDVYEFLYAHKTGKGHINVTCTLRQCTDNRHVLFQVMPGKVFHRHRHRHLD